VRRMLNASQEMDDSLYDGQNDISIIENNTTNDKRISKQTSVPDKTPKANKERTNTVAAQESMIEPIVKPVSKRNHVEYLLENPPEWYFGYLRREKQECEPQNVRICHREQRSPQEIGHEKFLEIIKALAIDKESVSISDSNGMLFESSSDKIASEEDTQVVIKKEDFLRMRVLWQFNKSFIFCNLDKHLFIVDQHAADEKANYENYMKNAKLKRQMLIKPMILRLSPVHEQILRNNFDVFLKNGFDFTINESLFFLNI
jgi:DNA mismatch repair ATPase MutL